jgi:phospholipid transport system substrate-binding protein
MQTTLHCAVAITGAREMPRKILSAVFAFLSIAFCTQSMAQEAPDKMIQRITGEVLTAVRSSRQVQSGDPRSIQQIVEEKILPNLDFERTTALAAGRYWRDATSEQKTQLETEFRSLLMHTYSGAMSQIPDRTIVYEPLRADPADTDVAVYAHVISTSGQPIRFGYRLIKSPTGWKVYDVNVLGAWLVQTYKESFEAEIRSGGIDGLIKTLSDKNKSLAANASKNAKLPQMQ